MSNNLKNTRIEFHILQSFPVSCLNRDDSGSPKNAIIGGTQRARVSSQCWKRAVRLAMKELGVNIACRTKLIGQLIYSACIERNASEDEAQKCATMVSELFTESSKKDEIENSNKKSSLFFISSKEVIAIADFFQERNFIIPEKQDQNKDKSKNTKKSDAKKTGEYAILGSKLTNLLASKLNTVMDGVDIALFGRMAASAPDVNVEAAASFAHAISTHKVAAEVEFFTAVDDKKAEDGIQGSAHMGSLEFNSATYYRYISIDLGKLYENLGEGDLDLTPAIAAFTKALFLAIPGARQATMAANSPWDFAKVLVRKGQRLQVSFEDAVRTSRENPSLLKASRAALETQIDRFEKISGSLFGKIAAFDFGEDTSFSIDDLVESLAGEVRKLQEAR